MNTQTYRNNEGQYINELSYATEFCSFTDDERAIALARHLEINLDEVSESTYQETSFDADGGSYEVLTESEADEAWEASLDSYLEECIYPDLPESMQHYFDDEAWKRDARFDGRGHSLNHYDGSEEQEVVNDTYYYIYRTN